MPCRNSSTPRPAVYLLQNEKESKIGNQCRSLGENKEDNLNDRQGGSWVVKKLAGKINGEAAAVVAVLLMRDLSNLMS